jgi:hypothetical protein
MKYFAIALVLCLSGMPAMAQDADVSHFCGNSIVAFFLEKTPSGQRVDAALAKVAEQCKPGDIVGFPAEEVAMIGRACDFTRPIIQTYSPAHSQNAALIAIENVVLCVYQQPRPNRH